MVTFRRQLWSLARTSPGYRPVNTDAFGGYEDDELARRRSLESGGSDQAAVPPRTARAGGSYRRRRHILTGLTVLAIGSVAPAVVLGGAWWIGQGAVGGLLLAYLALLVRRRRRLAERLQKVRYLAPIRAPRPAVVVLGTGTAR
jgi:hypothetical protein